MTEPQAARETPQRWEWKGYGMAKDPNGHWVWYGDVPISRGPCQEPIAHGQQAGRPCQRQARYEVDGKNVCGKHAAMLR